VFRKPPGVWRCVMLELDTRKMMSAASAAVAAPAGAIPISSPRVELSAEAQRVAAEPVAPAYSPIVLAGTVRLVEFGLVMLVGLTVYAGYVVPIDGFEWYYVGAVAAIATLAMLAFQAADIYQVQAFRGHEKQYFRMASA